MTLRLRTYTLTGALALVLLMSACAKAPQVPQLPTAPALPPLPPPQQARARLTLAATADTNPNAQGRPSPVVVRVYQLKTDTAFAGAEFFALFDDEKKVLGPELIDRAEYVLAPNERRTLEMDVSADARYVGVLAAYRDIQNAQWRTLVQWPLKGDAATISVERARVVLAATN